MGTPGPVASRALLLDTVPEASRLKTKCVGRSQAQGTNGLNRAPRTGSAWVVWDPP